MSLGKRELIISIVALVVFVVISINVVALATNTGNIQFNEWTSGSTNTNTNQTIDITNSIKDGETNIIVSIPTNTNTNSNTNASGNLANTGLEDELPWLVIVLCGVSAIFAYKKIKDYNNID